MVLAHVGEERPAVDIADGVQPGSRHRRDAQGVVDGHGPTGLEPHGVEAEISGVGPATDGDEDLVGSDRTTVLERGSHGGVVCVPVGGDQLGARDDGDAFGRERGRELLAGERLLVRYQPLGGLDDRHLAAAEPAPGLRHLHADRSASQHHEPVGHVLGRGDVAVVPRPDVTQPVDGWNDRNRSGRQDHGPGRRQRPLGAVSSLDLDPSFAGQPAAAPHEGGPQPVEPPDLALVVPPGGHPVPPGQRLRRVEVPGDGRSGPRHPTCGGEHLSRPQEGLARHARPVGALATHQLALDQRRAQPGIDAPTHGVLTRRSSPHHDHVVGVCHRQRLLVARFTNPVPVLLAASRPPPRTG